MVFLEIRLQEKSNWLTQSYRNVPARETTVPCFSKYQKACLGYFTFDTSDADKAHSEAAIAAVYGSTGNKHFLNDEAFFSSKENGAIDVVVMRKVLHEISAHE